MNRSCKRVTVRPQFSAKLKVVILLSRSQGDSAVQWAALTRLNI